MEKNKWKFYILMTITVLVIMCVGISPMAAYGKTNTGSLSLECCGTTEDGERIALSDVPFVIYQAVTVRNGEWQIAESFQGVDVDWDDMTMSGKKANSEKLYEYAVGENLESVKKYTDKNGVVIFSDLEQGIYLVAQEKDFSYKDGKFRSAPFLLYIPTEVVETQFYDIEAQSKIQWFPDEEEEISSNVKITTGDRSNSEIYLLACLGAVMLLIGLMVTEKDKNSR